VNSYFYELRIASFFESWDEGEFGGGGGGVCQALFKLGFKKKVENIIAKLNPTVRAIFPK
jgi:hypothetical protein